MTGFCKTYTVRLLAVVTVPRPRTLSRPLHGAEQLLLPIWEERVYWKELWKKSIEGRLAVLASKGIWKFSVTHTTKESFFPSVINLDAQAAQRFWGRNLQALTKERELLGAGVCWFSSVFFKLKKHIQNTRLLRKQRIPEKFLILMQKMSSH